MSGRIMELNASFLGYGCAVGNKEFAGPLGDLFDIHDTTDRFGMSTWEKAESEMQRLAFNVALKKSALTFESVGALFAGDLQNQCVGSSYGLLGNGIPYFGIYGACSTSAEGIMLAAVLAGSGKTEICAAVTSSHNCSAERQFRSPVEYGGQRAPVSQWTVTGAGAFLIGGEGAGRVRIVSGMPGAAIDRGINDPANMGAAMAPAVCDTLLRYFSESGTEPADYDLIVTGDLGYEGADILRLLLRCEGCELGDNYTDCGILIYDKERQDTHSGGSGCGCSAAVLSAYILPRLESRELNNVLFVASGALMSPDSIKQGRSIAGIGHLLHFRSDKL